ncbi:hypothetical protein PCE1_001425 [Barthelona sp. PCE]
MKHLLQYKPSFDVHATSPFCYTPARDGSILNPLDLPNIKFESLSLDNPFESLFDFMEVFVLSHRFLKKEHLENVLEHLIWFSSQNPIVRIWKDIVYCVENSEHIDKFFTVLINHLFSMHPKIRQYSLVLIRRFAATDALLRLLWERRYHFIIFSLLFDSADEVRSEIFCFIKQIITINPFLIPRYCVSTLVSLCDIKHRVSPVALEFLIEILFLHPAIAKQHKVIPILLKHALFSSTIDISDRIVLCFISLLADPLKRPYLSNDDIKYLFHPLLRNELLINNDRKVSQKDREMFFRKILTNCTRILRSFLSSWVGLCWVNAFILDDLIQFMQLPTTPTLLRVSIFEVFEHVLGLTKRDSKSDIQIPSGTGTEPHALDATDVLKKFRKKLDVLFTKSQSLENSPLYNFNVSHIMYSLLHLTLIKKNFFNELIQLGMQSDERDHIYVIPAMNCIISLSEDLLNAAWCTKLYSFPEILKGFLTAASKEPSALSTKSNVLGLQLLKSLEEYQQNQLMMKKNQNKSNFIFSSFLNFYLKSSLSTNYFRDLIDSTAVLNNRDCLAWNWDFIYVVFNYVTNLKEVTSDNNLIFAKFLDGLKIVDVDNFNYLVRSKFLRRLLKFALPTETGFHHLSSLNKFNRIVLVLKVILKSLIISAVDMEDSKVKLLLSTNLLQEILICLEYEVNLVLLTKAVDNNQPVFQRFRSRSVHNNNKPNDVREINLEEEGVRLRELLRLLGQHRREVPLHLQSFHNSIFGCMVPPPPIFSISRLSNTLTQEIFNVLGVLSSNELGISILRHTGYLDLFYKLREISSIRVDLVLLLIMSLDYRLDADPRVYLSQACFHSKANIRLFITQFFRYLMRNFAQLRIDSDWLINVLITQLWDEDEHVSSCANSILMECANDINNISAIIAKRPNLEKIDSSLLLKLFSVEGGFEWLYNVDWLAKTLANSPSPSIAWLRQLDDTFARAFGPDTVVKILESNQKYRNNKSNIQRHPILYDEHHLPVINIEPHLYDQLVQTQAGTDYLREIGVFESCFDFLRKFILYKQSYCEFDVLKNSASLRDYRNLEFKRATICDCLWLMNSQHSLQYVSVEYSSIIRDLHFFMLTTRDLDLRFTIFVMFGLLSSNDIIKSSLDSLGWHFPASAHQFIIIPTGSNYDRILMWPNDPPAVLPPVVEIPTDNRQTDFFTYVRGILNPFMTNKLFSRLTKLAHSERAPQFKDVAVLFHLLTYLPYTYRHRLTLLKLFFFPYITNDYTKDGSACEKFVIALSNVYSDTSYEESCLCGCDPKYDYRTSEADKAHMYCRRN